LQKIGDGTVSAIIKQCKQKQYVYENGDYFEFNLIGELAVMLKGEGVDVNSFTSSLRLQRELEVKGLSEVQIESFVENIDVHCFCSGLKSEEFEEFVNTIKYTLFLNSSLEIN
jgi:hypothetical protein